MKRKFTNAFFLLVSVLAFSQPHWESIVLEDNMWSYLQVTSEPPSDWFDINYDDDLWNSGREGIDYGDGEVTTICDAISSLYMRNIFNISDTSIIKASILNIDYDDAFVAYLNGVEVAHSENITEYSPSYNSEPTAWREAEMYLGNLPERYTLDRSLLVEGSNILAVHILNYTATSSDLTARVFLNAEIDASEIIYNETPEWFTEPEDEYDPTSFTSSNLPLVVINTNGQSIPDEPKIVANMGIINNGAYAVNNISDPYTDYEGRISIEIRGQSSQSFPKKSYSIETQDEEGENINVSLLGMSPENDWVLYAPYSDKSMLRNAVSMAMGRELDIYCSHTIYCDLVLNGEYQGCYLLMEKIKRDENRVDIGTLYADEISGDDLTGGYIFKVDKVDNDFINNVDGFTSRPYPSYPNAKDIIYQYYYPDADDLADEQRDYLKDYILTAEEVLIGSGFSDLESGYNNYLNIGSFVDFMITAEISKEVDKYRYSTFFYKKKESKGNEIFAGPIWDFNLGYANVDYWAWGLSTEGWLFENVSNSEWSIIFWWKRLMEDDHFNDLFTTRWVYLRENELSNENIRRMIESITDYIYDAQQVNYLRWPILGTYVWPNYDWRDNDYNDEVAYFENWLFERLDWMDNNVDGTILNPAGTITQIDNTSSDKMQLTISLTNDYFNHSELKTDDFTLNNSNSDIIVDDVNYTDASTAILTIAYNASSSSLNPELSVTIDNKILHGFRKLTTNSLNITSIDDVQFASANFKIYVSNGMMNIECDRPDSMSENLNIYNTLGQCVGVYHLEKQFKNTIYPGLNQNVYFVRVMADGVPLTQQVVITE